MHISVYPHFEDCEPHGHLDTKEQQPNFQPKRKASCNRFSSSTILVSRETGTGFSAVPWPMGQSSQPLSDDCFLTNDYPSSTVFLGPPGETLAHTSSSSLAQSLIFFSLISLESLVQVQILKEFPFYPFLLNFIMILHDKCSHSRS